MRLTTALPLAMLAAACLPGVEKPARYDMHTGLNSLRVIVAPGYQPVIGGHNERTELAFPDHARIDRNTGTKWLALSIFLPDDWRSTSGSNPWQHGHFQWP